MSNSDDVLRGFHTIPAESRLRRMTQLELLDLCAGDPVDSIRRRTVELELLRRQDVRQATYLVLATIIGAIVGGAVSLSATYAARSSTPALEAPSSTAP